MGGGTGGKGREKADPGPWRRAQHFTPWRRNQGRDSVRLASTVGKVVKRSYEGGTGDTGVIRSDYTGHPN